MIVGRAQVVKGPGWATCTTWWSLRWDKPPYNTNILWSMRLSSRNYAFMVYEFNFKNIRIFHKAKNFWMDEIYLILRDYVTQSCGRDGKMEWSAPPLPASVRKMLCCRIPSTLHPSVSRYPLCISAMTSVTFRVEEYLSCQQALVCSNYLLC